MPTVTANNLTMNYDQQGVGDPLILIPYLAADHACYAFQVADFAKQFTCISLDLRGTGGTDKPAGSYSMELFADDIAAFMQALGVQSAHVFGLSLGAAVGMWLAAKHPRKVRSLSLFSAWPRTDPFLDTVVRSWQVMAKALGSVPETTIQGIFPWCFTPELYGAKPDYIQSLSDFVRSRPAQPLEAFEQQSNAVIKHDVTAQLGRIKVPTQLAFGQRDVLTSTRFAEQLRRGIADSEVVMFEDCAHAPIYEKVQEVNRQALAFFQRHSTVPAGV